ncbi:hypothetical protein HNO89_001931 [Sporosarcina luteola]|nr:hypothetical protein [Sporosarcina luteola]
MFKLHVCRDVADRQEAANVRYLLSFARPLLNFKFYSTLRSFAVLHGCRSAVNRTTKGSSCRIYKFFEEINKTEVSIGRTV